jgi:hypothetical protein
MTRKDYILISEVLKEIRGLFTDGEMVLFNDIINRFARRLYAENDNFDVARFREACRPGRES